MIPNAVNVPQAPLGHPHMLRSGSALLAMYLMLRRALFVVLLGMFVQSPVTVLTIVFSIQVITFQRP